MTNEQKNLVIEAINEWFEIALTDPEMWGYSVEVDDNGSIEASWVEAFTNDLIDGSLSDDDFHEIFNDPGKLEELKAFIKKYIYDSDKISIARKAWNGELDYSEYDAMFDDE